MSGKVLKRVYGDAYLAPVKLDQSRPITAGVPLRRCNNDISISIRDAHATNKTSSRESSKQTESTIGSTTAVTTADSTIANSTTTESTIAKSTTDENTIAQSTIVKSTPASSTVGDGDMTHDTTPPESGKETTTNASIVLSTPTALTPVSNISFLSEGESFKLTFRKPKPRLRPRSIVTNSSSNKPSLRSTASTPSPITPVVPLQGENIENIQKRENSTNNNDNNNNVNLSNGDIELNNNETEVNDYNNNRSMSAVCSKEMDNQKPSKSLVCLKKDSAAREKVTVVAMPNEVNYESTSVVSGKSGKSSQKSAARGHIFEPDESFWHSDSTPSEHVAIDENPSNAPDPATVPETAQTPTARDIKDSEKSSKRKSSHKTKTTVATTNSSSDNSSSSYASEETSSEILASTPERYPYSYYAQGSGQTDGPFVTTEKGAIRFHLPGRIQHKTTIKVAHFPTGEEKNLVLNVKPEKEEEEPCVEIPSPCCANNQNFTMPPPPPPAPYYSPYPYNPYGYGGSSPYSPENYYRYFGYSPYPS